PVKPRQPVAARCNDQVPIPARRRNAWEKMGRAHDRFPTSSRPVGRGFLLSNRAARTLRQHVNEKERMQNNAGFMKALKCRECGREYPLAATHVCEFDFGPLEVVYDYDRIKLSLNHSGIQSRPQTM